MRRPPEVVKARDAGFESKNILYSSPGKTAEDIARTLDKAVIVADSYNELAMTNEICAKRVKRAMIGLRINPNVRLYAEDSDVMAGVSSKFGVDEELLLSNKKFIDSLKYVKITGIHVYLRSQILDEKAIYNYFRGVFNIANFCVTQMNWELSFIDFGGGFGIPYSKGDRPICWEELQPQIKSLVQEQTAVTKNNVRLIIESGRFFVSAAGIFLTKVVDVKESRGQKFIIVHGGLNGFFRPAIMTIFRQIAPAKLDVSLEPLFTSSDAHGLSIPAKIGQPLELVSVAGNLCTGSACKGRVSAESPGWRHSLCR